MTNRKTLITTFGFLSLFLLSWFIPSSKIQVFSILADAQALQEVSQRYFSRTSLWARKTGKFSDTIWF